MSGGEEWCFCRGPDEGDMVKCDNDNVCALSTMRWFALYPTVHVLHSVVVESHRDVLPACVQCKIEWFHAECVGLRRLPADNETWFCPKCIAAGASGPAPAPHADLPAAKRRNIKPAPEPAPTRARVRTVRTALLAPAWNQWPLLLTVLSCLRYKCATTCRIAATLRLTGNSSLFYTDIMPSHADRVLWCSARPCCLQLRRL
jgi:hypothetical protein